MRLQLIKKKKQKTIALELWLDVRYAVERTRMTVS